MQLVSIYLRNGDDYVVDVEGRTDTDFFGTNDPTTILYFEISKEGDEEGTDTLRVRATDIVAIRER
jgi:hypothetical protein